LKPISLSKAKFVNFTRALQKEAWVAYRNYGKQIVASCVEMATGNGRPFKTHSDSVFRKIIDDRILKSLGGKREEEKLKKYIIIIYQAKKDVKN
jgi:hypothetical protein